MVSEMKLNAPAEYLLLVVSFGCDCDCGDVPVHIAATNIVLRAGTHLPILNTGTDMCVCVQAPAMCQRQNCYSLGD